MEKKNAIAPGAPAKKALTLTLLGEKFCISKLPQFAEMPAVLTKGEMCFLLRTEDELVVISPEFMAPTNVQQETGWRCIRVETEGLLHESGVIASLTAPLAAKGASVFLLSTFNALLMFLQEEDLAKATDALQKSGLTFATEG